MWLWRSTSVADCWAPARSRRPRAALLSWFAGQVRMVSLARWASKAPVVTAQDWPAGLVLGISPLSKWIGLTDAPVGGVASQTRSMPKQQHARSWRGLPPPSPRLAPAP